MSGGRRRGWLLAAAALFAAASLWGCAQPADGPARTLFESEARYTDLYGLCFPAPRPCGAEWIHSPVVGERA